MGIKVMVRGANINFGELFGYFWKRALIIYQGYISKKKKIAANLEIYMYYIFHMQFFPLFGYFL